MRVRLRGVLALVALAAGCDDEQPPKPIDAALVIDQMPVDAYVPRPDLAPPGPSDPEDFEACVETMVREVEQAATRAGCDDYNDLERQDPGSDFNTRPAVAACVELACENRTLDGHNGIPATRACAELLDLAIVLRRARDEALSDVGCVDPTFRQRVIALDDFVGGEPCDQYGCTSGPDGVMIIRERSP